MQHLHGSNRKKGRVSLMATQQFTQTAPTAQKTQATIEFIPSRHFVLPDGVHPFNDPIDKWCVVVGGEITNYATWQSTAYNQYREALRVRREHFASNPGEGLN